MRVTVTGNLCADPTLRHTSGGTPVAELRVAENRNYQDRDGEWQQDTSYYTVTAWRRLAEHAAECLHKGDRVVVTGRMRQDQWTTETGESRSRYLVDADDLAASVRYATVEITKPDRTGEPTEPRTYAPDDPGRPFGDPT